MSALCLAPEHSVAPLPEVARSIIGSPLGPLRAEASPHAITALQFAEEEIICKMQPSHPILRLLAQELVAYFSGRLTRFSVPLAPQGTPFQQRVWQELARIPYGETISYAQQASLIDRPQAIRAVARGNGSNPLPILLPCHRVIGSNGSLTGYSAGLQRKAWLLAHEQRYHRPA